VKKCATRLCACAVSIGSVHACDFTDISLNAVISLAHSTTLTPRRDGAADAVEANADRRRRCYTKNNTRLCSRESEAVELRHGRRLRCATYRGRKVTWERRIPIRPDQTLDQQRMKAKVFRLRFQRRKQRSQQLLGHLSRTTQQTSAKAERGSARQAGLARRRPSTLQYRTVYWKATSLPEVTAAARAAKCPSPIARHRRRGARVPLLRFCQTKRRRRLVRRRLQRPVTTRMLRRIHLRRLQPSLDFYLRLLKVGVRQQTRVLYVDLWTA